jgi:hypothetical protein
MKFASLLILSLLVSAISADKETPASSRRLKGAGGKNRGGGGGKNPAPSAPTTASPSTRAPKTPYPTALPTPTAPSPTSSGGKNGGKNKGKSDSDDDPTLEPTLEPTAESTTEPTAGPTAEPTTEPTLKPTVEPTVLTFYSVNTDPDAVGPLYNLAVQGRYIDFNDDGQYCTNGNNPTCVTLDHSTCNISNPPTASSIANVPISMTFDGIVNSGTSSCCGAKSCAAVYLDTEPATLSTADTFSYTVSF